MQTQKDYTKELILKSAETMFKRDGFAKTSMRDIAGKAGTGVSNMYNYFRNKDEIFCLLVRPVTEEMDRMMVEHHDPQRVREHMAFMTGDRTDGYIAEQADCYQRLATKHHDALLLLLFKANGSSLEDFIDRYTDRCTSQVQSFMEAAGRHYPNLNTSFAQFTIHLHTVWMFTFLRELLTHHHLKNEDTKQLVTDYIRFECAGWRELISR